MEVICIKKILVRNWPIGICLHCVRTLSWFVPTMSTLKYIYSNKQNDEIRNFNERLVRHWVKILLIKLVIGMKLKIPFEIVFSHLYRTVINRAIISCYWILCLWNAIMCHFKFPFFVKIAPEKLHETGFWHSYVNKVMNFKNVSF